MVISKKDLVFAAQCAVSNSALARKWWDLKSQKQLLIEFFLELHAQMWFARSLPRFQDPCLREASVVFSKRTYSSQMSFLSGVLVAITYSLQLLASVTLSPNSILPLNDPSMNELLEFFEAEQKRLGPKGGKAAKKLNKLLNQNSFINLSPAQERAWVNRLLFGNLQPTDQKVLEDAKAAFSPMVASGKPNRRVEFLRLVLAKSVLEFCGDTEEWRSKREFSVLGASKWSSQHSLKKVCRLFAEMISEDSVWAQLPFKLPNAMLHILGYASFDDSGQLIRGGHDLKTPVLTRSNYIQEFMQTLFEFVSSQDADLRTKLSAGELGKTVESFDGFFQLKGLLWNYYKKSRRFFPRRTSEDQFFKAIFKLQRHLKDGERAASHNELLATRIKSGFHQWHAVRSLVIENRVLGHPVDFRIIEDRSDFLDPEDYLQYPDVIILLNTDDPDAPSLLQLGRSFWQGDNYKSMETGLMGGKGVFGKKWAIQKIVLTCLEAAQSTMRQVKKQKNSWKSQLTQTPNGSFPFEKEVTYLNNYGDKKTIRLGGYISEDGDEILTCFPIVSL